MGTVVAEKKNDGAALPRRSEIAVFCCWLAGLALLLVSGWGFIIICYLIAKACHLDVSFQAVLGTAGLLSFGMLYLLERNLWLSRFMGLRLGPHSTPLNEALFFWITWVPGLLLRSSDQPSADAKTQPQADGVREIVETIVFVVVLVLLLKTFLVEAFVIPTGSMAETLWGYQKMCTCKKCHYRFPINCSSEAEPPPGHQGIRVEGGFCPICRFKNVFPHLGVDDPNQR